MIPARVRPSRPVIGAAVAVAALLSGAGVALAASASPSAPRTAANAGTGAAAMSVSSSPSRCRIKLPAPVLPLLPGRSFAFLAPPVPLGFRLSGAIHVQLVVPKQGGGYQTIDVQRGKVTAVSTSSLTVRSSDGYTKTYQVTTSTSVVARRTGIGSVKAGQTVSVLATVHGSAATATRIVDLALLTKPTWIPMLLPKLPEFPKPGLRHMFKIGPCVFRSISR